jgi:hypothetical protein
MKRVLLSLMAALAPVCAAQPEGTVTLQVLGPAVYVRQARPPVSRAVRVAEGGL